MADSKRCRTRSHDPEIKKMITSILGMLKTRSGKDLKKEYIREHSIRNHKKLLRTIYKPSQKKYHKLIENTTNEFSKSALEAFTLHAKSNQKALNLLSKTDSGPATDGKSKRTQKKMQKRSFNDFFVRDYFSNSVVKESFMLYIVFKFSEMDAGKLCEGFKYYCCKSNRHSDECLRKWKSLKEFFIDYMFKDLDDRFAITYKNEEKKEIQIMPNTPKLEDKGVQIGNPNNFENLFDQNELNNTETMNERLNLFGYYLRQLNFAYIGLISSISK